MAGLGKEFRQKADANARLVPSSFGGRSLDDVTAVH